MAGHRRVGNVSGMQRTRTDAALMVGASLILVLGSFLSWADLLGQSVSGVDGGDGWMTITAAVVFGAFGVRLLLGNTELPLWFAWAALLTSIGIAGINLLDILDTGGDDVAVGVGMKLMVMGGFFGALGLADYSWSVRTSSHTE